MNKEIKMKYEKKHRWVLRVLIILIKAHRKNEKLSVQEIRSKLDKLEVYDDITFSQKEARIWKILDWLSQYEKLSDVRTSKTFFDMGNDKDEFSELFKKIFNEETADLRVIRFGDLWGLEKAENKKEDVRREFIEKFLKKNNKE